MDALSGFTYQGDLKQALRCKKQERNGEVANLDLKRQSKDGGQ